MVHVDAAESIILGRDGVSLECDGREALFLPEVAGEHGWTLLELLEQLARKAGLPAEAWRRARLSTFRSERFGETEGRAARIRRS
jgi:AMMECR1 domain-containing protein